MATNPVNAFGQQLLSQWRPQHVNENIIFSPLSIAVCFLLVYNGTRGTTKTELETLFNFDDERVRRDLRSKSMSYAGDSLAKMANRLYVEESTKVQKDFVASIGSANIASCDFKNAFEESRVEINAWVSERTAEWIPNLIPSGALSSNTLLVAVNALYFKGKWHTPFPAHLTRRDTFYAFGEDQSVPFMTQNDHHIRVKEVDTLNSLLFAMPYEGDAFTMYVLLPNERDGWIEAENDLPAHIDTLFNDGFMERMVDTLKMPKWEMELSLESLDEILENLGLSTAFSSLADFSGMTEDEHLFISQVIHKAKVVVDEEGTEAAAATAAIANSESASATNSTSFNIIVDHPFLYFIVDEADGAVLFQGTQTGVN